MQEQADPCFAKVVEGQDVIRQLEQLPTYKPAEDFAYFFQQPVVITSARIMDTLEKKHTLQEDVTLRKQPRQPRNVQIEHEIKEQVNIEMEQE
jgi:hypothetical protein